jgi:hypothetical protein
MVRCVLREVLGLTDFMFFLKGTAGSPIASLSRVAGRTAAPTNLADKSWTSKIARQCRKSREEHYFF